MARPGVLLIMLFLTLIASAQGPEQLDSLWKAYHSPTATAHDRARTLDDLSHAMRMVDPDSSLMLAMELVQLAGELKDTALIAEGYRNAGLALFISGNTDEAFSTLETAFHLFTTQHDPKFLIGAGYAQSNMGYLHKAAGRLDVAMEHYRRSLGYLEAAPDPKGLIYSYNDIGQIHYVQGRPDSALAYYEQVVLLAEDLGLDLLASWGYNNMGTVYSNTGRIAEAIDMTYRTMGILERVDDQHGIAVSLISLSDLKSMLGELDASLAIMHRAYRIFSELNDKQNMARSGSGIGGISVEMGQMDSARFYLEGALALEREGGFIQEKVHTMSTLARIYRLLDLPKEAELVLEEAVGLAREMGDVASEAYILSEWGHIELMNGNNGRALTLCHKSIQLSEVSQTPLSWQNGCSCLHLAYKQQGNWRKALQYHELYVDIGKNITMEKAQRKMTQREMQYEFGKTQLADSLRHANERAQLENQRTIEKLRADQNSDRAVAIGIGAVLLIGGGGTTFYVDRKRRRDRFEKEAATLETQALRSQMNPHFIFNALNSINAFVQRNDQDRASSYLSKFARVMRLVLENSRHAEVPLKDDLEALRGYLDLERMRMEKKFDFTISVDTSIDPDDVMVPPLVVQPFVENAIWHGMAGKESGGLIELSVSRQGEQLVWCVQDNGAGRQIASTPAIGNGSMKKTSLGTTITRARLDLVQKQHGGKAGFTYTDLAQGTRVEVNMPLLSAY